MSGEKRDRGRGRRPADDMAQGFEQLARGVGRAVEDVGDLVSELAGSLNLGQRRSPASRLLKLAEKKRRGWRQHLRAYAVVVPGLMLFNALTLFSEVPFFPWSVMVAVFWGMGLALHGLNYRGWLDDNRQRIAQARLECETADGTPPPTVASPAVTAEPEGALAPDIAQDPIWADLLERSRAAVRATRAAMADSEVYEATAEEVEASLEAGLADLERLALGAARLQKALLAVVPGGEAAIDGQLTELQGRIEATDDEGLRRMYAANLALLQARKAKVAALTAERARMRARAEGFLLAVENLRLDATRLGTDPSTSPDLAGPLADLSSEVEILRQVEAELAGF